MEKKLIKFNEAEYNAALKRANTDLGMHNDLLKSIKNLIPDIEFNKQRFTALISNPKEFAFDIIMAGKTLELSGVPIGKQKAMNLIEYPANWLNAIQVIEAFNKKIASAGLHKGPYSNDIAYDRHGIEDFELNNGEFTLSPDFLENVKSKHSLYTQTENQNKALEHLNAMHESFTELQKLGVSFGNDMSLREVGFSAYGGFDSPYQILFDPSSIVLKVRG
jgi:hypothetical protein